MIIIMYVIVHYTKGYVYDTIIMIYEHIPLRPAV